MNEDKNSVLKTAASFELIFPVAEPLYNKKSLNNHDRDQLLWARETEHPTQTAGRQPGWGHCYLRSSHMI